MANLAGIFLLVEPFVVSVTVAEQDNWSLLLLLLRQGLAWSVIFLP